MPGEGHRMDLQSGDGVRHHSSPRGRVPPDHAWVSALIALLGDTGEFDQQLVWTRESLASGCSSSSRGGSCR